MDIKASLPYPSGALSNFAPHKFIFDGVLCASMEGWLQSLLEHDEKIQAEICQLVGIEAKRLGLELIKNWDRKTLWWKGRKYDRHSQEYQELLNRAYEALFTQCEDFREALWATGNENLTHSIGVSDPYEDILTEEEFVLRLMKLRDKLYS